MIRTYRKKLVFGMFGFILVLATGCQSVGGVNVNQALINNFNIQSSEANLSVAIDLVPKSTATQEQRAMQDKIKGISLSFHDIKTQDPQHASYQGALTTTRGKVPFAIHVNGQQTIVKIEGANKPIVFDQGQMVLSSAGSDQGSSSISQTLLPRVKDALMDKSGDLVPLLIGFIASHVDNPNKITVTPVTETIHSQSLNLNKLHTEISGAEAGEMIQKLLSNIGADEKGLQEVLGALYDVVAPELLKNKDSLSPLLVMVLENKELAVHSMNQMVKEYIGGASEKATVKMKEGNTFADQMYVKTDMYLDSGLLAHKMTVEAMLPAPADNDRGIAAVKISATSDSWNINKPVKAEAIAVAGDTLQAGDSGNGKLLNPSELLSIFDKQSVGYKMLREDMQITRKRLQMIMGQDAGQDPGQSGRPFIKNGSTLVPVRYVVEQMDAQVKWDGEKKQVTVKDALTGNEIIFTINSKTALLNGRPFPLDTEAIINTGGSTYVPVRFITEQGLGGKISWDNSTRTVSIVRD